MQKTTEQLQADLDREKAYTTKLNRQIDHLRDQLRNAVIVVKSLNTFLKLGNA